MVEIMNNSTHPDAKTQQPSLKQHQSAPDVVAHNGSERQLLTTSHRSTATRSRRRRKNKARMGVTLDALDLQALDSVVAAADGDVRVNTTQGDDVAPGEVERRPIGRAMTAFGGHVLCRICEQRVASFALAVITF